MDMIMVDSELASDTLNEIFLKFRDTEKARKIYNMRLQGKTYAQIGQAVGLSGSRCTMYVNKIKRLYYAKQEKVKKSFLNFTSYEELKKSLESLKIKYESNGFKVTTINAILEAIEKQIPKKPEKMDYLSFTCPNCHCSDVCRLDYCQEYCKECGQKIKLEWY